MSTATIDLDEIRAAGKLIPLDAALDILHTTEPIQETVFPLDGSQKVEFSLPMGWNPEEVRHEPSTYPTLCTVRIEDGDPIVLTKEALLKMTSSVGLTKDYVLRTPGPLVQPNLNWWVKHNGVKGAENMRLLAKDGLGVAFVKDSLSTFPNLPVVERVIEQIRDRFGDDIWVDYKIAHSLERTALRLIVPSPADRIIDSARNSGGDEDRWSLGLQITNSIMGDPETRLNISGYLFAWWCTNGAVSTHATSGNYNRRILGQDFDEVLDWVADATQKIFTDLEPELDDIASLTQISLEGELNDVIADVFKQLRVPLPSRKGVLEALVDSDDLTAYGLMQAITQAANDPKISDKVRENTMRVGGLIPHTITDRCSSCHRVNLA